MLAIYKRNSKKEKKFFLAGLAINAKEAKKYSNDIITSFKEIGYDEIETTIIPL